MIARNAYTTTTYRLCGYHYDVAPPGLGSLGGVDDARDYGCEVCDATRAASRILAAPSTHVSDLDRGQSVVRVRDMGGIVVVRYDRSDGELTVRPDPEGDGRWWTADRTGLTPEAWRALDGLAS